MRRRVPQHLQATVSQLRLAVPAVAAAQAVPAVPGPEPISQDAAEKKISALKAEVTDLERQLAAKTLDNQDQTSKKRKRT